MSTPDWEDVASVRAWLEKRYSVAVPRNGSSFFQYLKDESTNGNKIRGRESRLSRAELARWLSEMQGDNAFFYGPITENDIYYPEYSHYHSKYRAQSPKEDGI